MITGELKSQVDRIWDAFWSGGISNPMEVIEQITYLLFIKRLDDLHTVRERKANRLEQSIEQPVFNDEQQKLRWSRFKNDAPTEMYKIVSEQVFPFIKDLRGDRENSTYAHHMKDARFTIPTAALLSRVVDMIDAIQMDDRDTKGDLYEYMLGKIATAGQNGQFRTPRHIIKMIVDMVEPNTKDIICDPASGTSGFLVAASEYLREHHSQLFADDAMKKHFNETAFNGYDFDSTMLRIGSMNMLLHGVENPSIKYKDSLSEQHSGDEELYTLILANPPFAGSLDYESCAKNLQLIVKTKKTELLFVALFLRLLKAGGRAAVIVPSGVLESDSPAHSLLRKKLVEENRLEAVITLPHWIFKPYASVATAILIFSKSGKTDSTWFYRMEHDGFNNGANKSIDHKNEIPEIANLWKNRFTDEYSPQPSKHRFVSYQEIVNNEYDLCERVYLSGYEYPSGIPLVPLNDLFTITKGNIGAAQAKDGSFPFISSSENLKSHYKYSFDSEAIGIPLVSSTGHGHASMKTIHYVNGKFEAATIAAVLMPKANITAYVLYVYYYLLVHKDQLLVPLMRGAANVSLNIERLRRLRIPLPPDITKQQELVSNIEIVHKQLIQNRSQLKDTESQYSQQLALLKSNI